MTWGRRISDGVAEWHRHAIAVELSEFPALSEEEI
jgi:hypothetical protein